MHHSANEAYEKTIVKGKQQQVEDDEEEELRQLQAQMAM